MGRELRDQARDLRLQTRLFEIDLDALARQLAETQKSVEEFSGDSGEPARSAPTTRPAFERQGEQAGATLAKIVGQKQAEHGSQKGGSSFDG